MNKSRKSFAQLLTLTLLSITGPYLVQADTKKPAWHEAIAYCNELIHSGWKRINPFDPSSEAVGQVEVSGIGKLCAAKMDFVSAKGESQGDVKILAAEGGTASFSVQLKIPKMLYRSSMLEQFAATCLAGTARIHASIPSEIIKAIREAKEDSEQSDGLQFRVSTESKEQALVLQPDLDPKTVPDLAVEFAVEEHTADEGNED